MDTITAVRNRILQLCGEHEISINKLATISALPPSSIKNILYGKSQNPKLITIKMICDGLGITLGEFFTTSEFDSLHVNYQVGAARVGEETEMDSLELEIWTDGRITPRNALEEAARILRDHLQPFMDSQIPEKPVVLNDEEEKLFKLLSQDVEVLDLSVRAMNCLNSANIKLVFELCNKTESKMLKYRNFGKKSLDEIKEKIEKLGLELGMTLSDRLLTALEAEAARVRADAEESN